MSEGIRRSPRILLASASPRREALLRAEGLEVICMPPDIDDSELAPHADTPSRWVVAMAWLKAARVREQALAGWSGSETATLIAADTVCDCDGRLVGKPANRADAEAMLRGLVGRAHNVHTGVCIVDLPVGRRRLLLDSSEVELGALDESAIRSYLDSGEWAGKAGAYNYADRVAAGWPLRCIGDPTSVMGLPMRRLRPLLGIDLVAKEPAG